MFGSHCSTRLNVLTRLLTEVSMRRKRAFNVCMQPISCREDNTSKNRIKDDITSTLLYQLRIQAKARELTMLRPSLAFDMNGTITHQNTTSVRMTAPALVCKETKRHFRPPAKLNSELETTSLLF